MSERVIAQKSDLINIANAVRSATGSTVNYNVPELASATITALENRADGPEAFGAKGDGVTDDSVAITQALLTSKNVVFSGDKTYAVGSVITIPPNAEINFNGATIVPLGNHDVIRMSPGAHLENLVVRCTDVSDWDAAALVLYGGDKFSHKNPTRINNIKLFYNTSSTNGLTTQGVGIKLYCDNYGQEIAGVIIDESMTHGFGVGVLLAGVDDTSNPNIGITFIGANKFRGHWSFMDNIAIAIRGHYNRDHITNNIFTDLQIEPRNNQTLDNCSSYGIYCDGFNNYFDGCLYDYFHNHTAVYFTVNAHNNVVKTTSGSIYKTENPVWCQDLGVSNTVTTFYEEGSILVPHTAITPRMIGNQDDYLAFINKRAECTLKSLDGEPTYGNLSNVFNPRGSSTLCYKTINPEENDRRAIITINLPTLVNRLSDLYMQFFSAPKSIKVTYYSIKEAAKVVYKTDNNTNLLIGICNRDQFGGNGYDLGKIVIELGGFNKIYTSGAATYGEWELVRIMGLDSYKRGETFLYRDGGRMYGDIKFEQNLGPVLKSENGKLYKLIVSDSGTLGTTEVQEEEEEAPEIMALTPTLLPRASWYNTEAAGVTQNSITSIVFNSAYEPTGEEDANWACDEDMNGNIMAYRNGTEVVIKSTTGSEGVKLNSDSTFMFANDGTNANFSKLASVTGTETWIADAGTNINNMCNNNSTITTPVAIPVGVTTMNYAFRNCFALQTAPVLPTGLLSMTSAFAACTGLRSLPEIPNTVTVLNYAFHGCTTATIVDMVIPASVSMMTGAFRNCVMLSGTIEINAEHLNEYVECFYQVSRDSSGLTLTGSCPLLAELAATAGANGKVTVATA